MKRFKKLIRKILGLDKCYFTHLEPKTYRLEFTAYLHIGVPPTINESAFHEPSTPIYPYMLLTQQYLIDGYIVLQISTNGNKKDSMNGQLVYYDKDLFSTLRKQK